MNIPEIMTGGITEIRHHKLRAFLTLIGMILGTMSIVFMTSMLNGIIISVWSGFEQLGYDGVLYVVARQPRNTMERARFNQSEGLRPEDADILLARRELVRDAAPVQQAELIFSAGGVRREVRVMGVTPPYAAVRKRFSAVGRFFNDNDLRTFGKVCILGHRLNKRLFGSEDPLGKEVTVGGARFIVVGVGAELGNTFVNDSEFIREMEGAMIPLTTLRRYFAGEESPLSYIAVKTTAVKSLGSVQAEVEAALSVAHHGIGDFQVENIAQDMLRERDQVDEIVTNWQIVLGTIAGISLLVGGIGLLSVMIISINERLYEIGMRKAIGASDLEIFLQFMVESITLALTGAGIGVGLGVGLTTSLSGFFPSGLPIDWGGAAWAVGLAISLGILFGLYPAIKASRMDPVEAMRAV
ncbi:MAG TPA: ABC transporter permease [Candidatus Polarisedimenticolia bacterium]|jgi:putative ABC transport system permease protein